MTASASLDEPFAHPIPTSQALGARAFPAQPAGDHHRVSRGNSAGPLYRAEASSRVCARNSGRRDTGWMAGGVAVFPGRLDFSAGGPLRAHPPDVETAQPVVSNLHFHWSDPGGAG